MPGRARVRAIEVEVMMLDLKASYGRIPLYQALTMTSRRYLFRTPTSVGLLPSSSGSHLRAQ